LSARPWQSATRLPSVAIDPREPGDKRERRTEAGRMIAAGEPFDPNEQTGRRAHTGAERLQIMVSFPRTIPILPAQSPLGC
jgi:hypothetical protein